MDDIYYLFFSFLTFTEKTCYFAPIVVSISLTFYTLYIAFKSKFQTRNAILKIKKNLFSLYSSMVKWMLTLKNMVLFK